MKPHHRPTSKRIKGFDAPSVWAEFSPLAAEKGAVNMGQGFPNFAAPHFIKKYVGKAVEEDYNQYARSQGHPKLVQQLARKYSPRFGREINPMKEIIVGNGATHVMFCIFQSLLNEGDEVIAFEPSFDIYGAQVQMSGGKLVQVPLRPVEKDNKIEWTFDAAELASKFTSKTRFLLLNTPHNPTGLMLSPADMATISDLLTLHPHVDLITDEVYEHQVYDREHVSYAGLGEDKWNRTITVSSAGKMFSATGWKIGWAIGPEHLINPIWLAHQWVCFSVATPLQEAVANALIEAEKEYEGYPTYYDWVRESFRRRRDRLVQVLEEAGMTCAVPNGGYFVMANTKNLTVPASYLADESITRDWALCRWLTCDVGVSPIPPSSFYCEENKHLAANYARFAFCKKEEDIEECGRRLKQLLL